MTEHLSPTTQKKAPVPFPFSPHQDPKKKPLLEQVPNMDTALDSAKKSSAPPLLKAKAPSSLANVSDSLEEKKAPFGLPFRCSSQSETDLFPHPQAMLASAIESHMHALLSERHYTTRSIIEIDLPRQEVVGEKFNAKLRESIEVAKSNHNLSYVQDALQILHFGLGVVGGVSILCSSLATNDVMGVLYGVEMTGGGMCSLGSFLLTKFGSDHSSPLLPSALSLGGAFLSLHGGIMGKDLLQMDTNFATYLSSAQSLLASYGLCKETQKNIDLFKFQGEASHLQRCQKMISDDLKEHYKGLDISNFTAFFRSAVDIIDSINETNKKIFRKTLKG